MFTRNQVVFSVFIVSVIAIVFHNQEPRGLWRFFEMASTDPEVAEPGVLIEEITGKNGFFL